MKNKKLFAILTLVCFMFTLMPVAAFAAVAGTYDAADYEVKVFDGTSYVEEVYVAPTQPVSVAALTAENTDADAVFYAVNAAGEAVQIKNTAAGTAASFAFKAPGTYTIYGFVDNTNGQIATLVGKTQVLVDGVSVASAVNTIEANLAADKIKVAATIVVEAPEAQYKVTVVSEEAGNIDANSGFTAAGIKEVTIKLENGSAPVVGKVPTIAAPDYLKVVPADAKKVVTNNKGEIKYYISANKAGNFEVVFGFEDAEEKTVSVVVNKGDVAAVEVVKESATLINKEYKATGINTGATVKFTDANGSVIDATPTTTSSVSFATTGLGYGDAIKVSVVSQPATSKLTAANFKLIDSRTPGASDLAVTPANAADLKVGTYEVQFALENGKAVTVAFEAAKMGDVVGIRFVQPATTVALGDKVDATSFPVQAYDAKGVTDTIGYTLSAQGKAIVTKEAGKVFVVDTDEKYIGSTITVLAKTDNNKFVATTTVEVVDNGNEVVYKTTSAEVGVTTVLNANVVDVKGNKVTVDATAMNIVVLDKPANAYVSATAAMGATDKDIAVTFLASVAGEYKIQTILVNSNGEFVTGIETIKVGLNDNAFKDVVVVSINADTIIVNDTVKAIPAAAVIENSRTFVPLRAVAEAFGAEVEWTPEAITAELGGVKVVMTTGDKAYTVNGVAKVADVAPYLNAEAATTMVPVSFIAQAFGINYQCIYAADGTVADVLFTK